MVSVHAAMRKILAIFGFSLFVTAAAAQTQPAQMGITPTTTPEVLQTLDNTKTWVPLGTVDSSTHKFSVVGGGGGGYQYQTHAALLAAITAAPTAPQAVGQQGFSAPGDGGDAIYQWSAASYCAGGTSSAPALADGVVCILPSAQAASTAGRYLLSNTGAVNVLQVGMQPGGFDNYPLVQTLMNAVSPPAGTSGGVEILFPPSPGQAGTYYYFSQPFVVARGSRINCRGGLGYDSQGPPTLVFGPGVDGIIQEWGSLTRDAGWGLSEVNGCGVMSLGGGSAAGAVQGSNTLNTVALHNRLLGQNFTMPASCTPVSGRGECAISAGDGLIVYSNWQPEHMAPAAPTGTYVTVSDPINRTLTMSSPITAPMLGYAGGCCTQGTYIWDLPASQKYSIRTMPSYVTTVAASSAYNTSTGDLALTFATAPLGATYAADTCFQMQVYGFNDTVGSDVNQLAGVWYVNSITGSGTVIHLQAPKGLTITSLSGGILYSNPVGKAGNALCATSGPRVLKAGDMIWSDAFLLGTTVTQTVNHLAGTPTVASGGSGYGGTSGTMTYSGIACDAGPPVLNVTASGGVITGVASVADRGNCMRFTPPSGDAKWVAGGGLSGGSGASFNTVYNEIAYLNCVAVENCPAAAKVIHPVGAEGQAWTIPAGIVKRTEGSAVHASVNFFGVGERGDCDPGFNPQTGCNASFDQFNTFTNNMIGRLMRGGNAGVSLAMSNIFAYNSLADEIEAGTVGSTYISEEYNSAEDGSSSNDFLGLCTTQNYSTIYGVYMSGQAGYCLGLDADGNPNIGVDVTANQGTMLFIGSIYGSPEPSIGPGPFINGHWTFEGGTGYAIPAQAATAAGSNVITLNNVPAIYAGMTVVDSTNPSVIPANTTVTFSDPSDVVISTPVTGAGVANGDQLTFYQPYGERNCTTIDQNVSNQTAALSFSRDCLNVNSLFANGYLNTWDIGGWIRFVGASYRGYNFLNQPRSLFQSGLLLGDSDGGGAGIERLIDVGDAPPTYHPEHAVGDVRFVSGEGAGLPVSGGAMAWSNVLVSRNRINADAAQGATTITIDACPSVPVGTAVVGEPGTVPGIGGPVPIGTMASCVGTTLTLQAGSASPLLNGDVLDFAAWRPAAPIANDANGTSWSLGNYLTLTPVTLPLPTCNTAGKIASVSNGQDATTAGYNAMVGATGATTRLVFCDGIHWTYH